MSEKATTADAEVLIKLYDLRREAEMRKARNWWLVSFNPDGADDFLKVGSELGSQENNWLRQVMGYWNMAASMVLAGAVNRDLFLEPSFSGEMFLIYAKIKPYLSEIREKMQNPNFFSNIEKLADSSDKSRQFMKYMENQVARRKEMAKQANA